MCRMCNRLTVFEIDLLLVQAFEWYFPAYLVVNNDVRWSSSVIAGDETKQLVLSTESALFYWKHPHSAPECGNLAVFQVQF